MVSLVSCRKIGDANYILANVSYKCDEEEYNKYTYSLVIPLLFLWMMVIPLVLFLALYKNRNKLDEY